MGTLYYEQLRRYLEPDSTSMHSKTKTNAANSPHSSLLHRVVGVKNKKDIFRNQRTHDSFNSFDTTALI